MATSPGALEVVLSDASKGTYAKLVVSDDAKILLGGILVGDASAYASLRPLVGRELPGDPGDIDLACGGEAGCRLAARRRRGVLVQRRDEGSHLRCNRSRRMRHRFGEGVHQRRNHLWRLPSHREAAAGRFRRRDVEGTVRTFRAVAGRVVPDRPVDADQNLLGADRQVRQGRRLRHLQARSRFDSGIDGLRSHPAPPAGVVAGHQRSLPREHPEERYVLRGTSDAGRRGHG